MSGRGEKAELEQLVHQRVDAADEEAGDRRDLLERLAGGLAALERAAVGVGHRLVGLDAEEQGDVDVDPPEQQILDGGHALGSPRDLDHEVRPVDELREVHTLRDGALGVPGQHGRHFEADEAVGAVGLLVHRHQDVAGVADILAGEVLVDLRGGPAAPRALGDLAVVGGAAADGLAEDRGVRRDASQVPVPDLLLQAPVLQDVPREVIHPVALAVLGQLAEAVHRGFSRRGLVLP